MTKRKREKAKPSKTKKKRRTKVVAVKHVDLPVDGVVRVTVPPGVAPVVHHDRGVIQIVPLPAAPKKKEPWWRELLFGI